MRAGTRAAKRPLLALRLLLLLRAAGAGVRPLQPLIEASGAVHGELVAGGQFCSPLAGSTNGVRPVLAVLEDSASLTVSLLAGPTPYLVRRLTPPGGPAALGRGGRRAPPAQVSWCLRHGGCMDRGCRPGRPVAARRAVP